MCVCVCVCDKSKEHVLLLITSTRLLVSIEYKGSIHIIVFVDDLRLDDYV